MINNKLAGDWNHQVQSALFGVAIGDALGVPFEFRSRSSLLESPVRDMTGYGTYDLPPGTWSDDSSLTFCLAESLTHGFDLNDMHGNVYEWCSDTYGPYPTTPQTNPKGAATGVYRVYRGGCWYSEARHCRSALRLFMLPQGFRGAVMGVRVVQIP